MFSVPEWLDFHDQISNGIDQFFNWFKQVFSWLFEIIRVIIITLLDLVQNILSNTPWWIWLFMVLVYIGFKYFTKIKAKIKWLTIIIILVGWLVFHNAVIENPAIDVTLGDITTPWWIFIVFLFFATRYLYKGYKMAIVLSLLLLFIALFGVWDAMLSTLAIIIIAVIFSFLIGIPVGILMAKSVHVKNVMQPILDMMQTIPSFVYLIPAIMLFSIGRVPATFATIIYAVPPLIRLTYLGIINVDKEMIEAGQAFGSTPRQLLFKIQIPQALATIATGLNQTTMMAVSMVVIASMIGAGGLGSIVLSANQQIAIGDGFVGGFAIVFLAIILDRLLQGVANKIKSSRGDQ
ncbi:MAG: ABC transporter permease [Acholeplasmataceae bacterium]